MGRVAGNSVSDDRRRGRAAGTMGVLGGSGTWALWYGSVAAKRVASPIPNAPGLNRSLGLYYINMAEGAQINEEKPGFFGRLFGSEPSKEEIDARAERYQVRLTAVGDSVQVTVDKDIDTVAPADVARRVLILIQDNLG